MSFGLLIIMQCFFLHPKFNQSIKTLSTGDITYNQCEVLLVLLAVEQVEILSPLHSPVGDPLHLP